MTFILIGGLVLVLVGLFMGLTAAFRDRTSWGVAIVVLPILYPLYALLRWSVAQTRNGFLIFIVGILVFALALYGGAGESLVTLVSEVPHSRVQHQVQGLVTKVPTARPTKAPLPNEAEAAMAIPPGGEQYDPLTSDDEYAYTKIEPLPPKEDKRVQPPAGPMVEYEYQQIDAAQVGDHLGKPIKITTQAGVTKEGKLTRVDKLSLSLETAVQGGNAAFEYTLDELATFFVYDVKGVILQVQQSAPEETAAQVASDVAPGDQPTDGASPSREAVAPPAPVESTPEPILPDPTRELASESGVEVSQGAAQAAPFPAAQEISDLERAVELQLSESLEQGSAQAVSASPVTPPSPQ